MQSQFKNLSTKDYILSAMINGNEIIPSDSFEIGNNEYILLEIMESIEGILYFKIMGIKGSHLGNRYVIPIDEFEHVSPRDLEKNLQHYQH